MPEHRQISKDSHSKPQHETSRVPEQDEHLTQDTTLPALQQSLLNPRLITPSQIVHLQRTIGNTAVQRLLASSTSDATAQAGEDEVNRKLESSINRASGRQSLEAVSHQPRQDSADTYNESNPLISTEHSPQMVIQRLITVAQWQEQTKTGYFPPRPRSTVANIDGPLGVYNTTPNLVNLNALITAIRAYIHSKEASDPGNVRLPPAQTLLHNALQDRSNLVSGAYDIAHPGHAVTHGDLANLSSLPMVDSDAQVHQLVNHAKNNHFIYLVGMSMGSNHTFADLTTILNGFPLFFQNPPNSVRGYKFVSLLKELSGADIIQVFNQLYNNDPTRPLDIVEALKHDGSSAVQIRDMVAQLAGAGLAPNDIYNMIRRQRQHLDTNAANQAPITAQGGTKGMTGPDLVAHVNEARTAVPALDPRTHYPTGQDFTARTIQQLWEDCNIAYAGGTVFLNETAAQKQRRQKLALGELMNRHAARRQTIQNIFTYQEGSAPRPFASIVNEDAYVAGAHTQARHTLGGAAMPNADAVATRALVKIPNCTEVASVYQSTNAANTHIKAAIQAYFPANWPAFRDNLTTGAPLPALSPAMGGVQGLAYRKTDAPKATADVRDLARPLRRDAPIDVDPTGQPPPIAQTYRVPLTGLIIVFRPEDTQPAAHGWGILTSYPQTPYP